MSCSSPYGSHSRRRALIAVVAVCAIAAVAGAVALRGAAEWSRDRRAKTSGASGATAEHLASRSFTNGEPCPRADEDLGLPSDSGCVTGASGDLDGDGGRDRFFVFARVDESRMPRAWGLRAELSSGVIARTTLRSIPSSTYPRLVRAVDADGDGGQELFVSVLDHLYHSGGTEELAIFSVESDGIEEVRIRGDGPMRIAVGGLTHFGSGARCDVAAQKLVVFELSDVNTGRFPDVTERVYAWKGDALELMTTRHRRLHTREYGDPRVYRYYTLRCST